jgi:glutamate--cysteine ligase
MGSPHFADVPVSSSAQLTEYFRAAALPRGPFRIGIEQEKIPVRLDGAPVPYDGPDGISALLGRLLARGFSPTLEDGHPIELARGEERITLEPGAQLELSGPALATAAGCAAALDDHVREVSELGRELGIGFVAGGFRPFGRLDEITWTPKRRYAVMREFLPRRGRLGIDMMKRTATVQANFDFADEADAVSRMRTACGVTSIVTAMFACSPLTEGRPNGHRSFRAAVWLDTDEARCGILPFVFEPDFGFARYVEWALDAPMFFVVRGGVYHPVGDALPFRRFMQEGWNGERPMMSDWERHLSTLFPEVRLKRTIEVRGADAGPMPFARGLGALWRGLLEDSESRAAAWALVAGFALADREALRREVPRAGLAARVAGRSLAELAVELCAIARAGLAALPGGEADAPLLDPLEEYARRGRCPADDLLDDFDRLGGDPARLVAAWQLEA